MIFSPSDKMHLLILQHSIRSHLIPTTLENNCMYKATFIVKSNLYKHY